MRRMAIFILSVSSLQFLFAWTATAFSYQHLSAFDRGADLALQISSAAGNASSAAITEMAAIQNDITVLDNRRNLFANFVFVCDTLLFAIAFGVFLCTVIICRRAIASVMSSLRLRRKNIINHAVANTLEEHSGRMLGISVLNMVALFVLMISYIIMGGGLVSIKSAAQCQGSYEAGPCSR
jgi:hypothetical protein